MKKRRYKSPIPPNAEEVIQTCYLSGEHETAHYSIDGELVGKRFWDEEGWTELEWGFKNGLKHGNELRWCGKDRLLFVEPYRNGRPHGTTKQFGPDGEILITYTMRNGVGLDLWCDDDGSLSEEAYWPACGEIGYTRRWNGDNKTVWQEYFYRLGDGWHGITREWNAARRLRRGFPKYFVKDKQVRKRDYIKACESDPQLVPFREEDNLPNRPLPKEYLDQRS